MCLSKEQRVQKRLLTEPFRQLPEEAWIGRFCAERVGELCLLVLAYSSSFLLDKEGSLGFVTYKSNSHVELQKNV